MRNIFFKKERLVSCFAAFLLLLSLTGCSTMSKWWSSLGFGEQTAESAEVLVMRGMDAYSHAKYEKSKKAFDALLSQYPFSEYSLLAELKSADSSYYLEHYEEALLLYKDFEERHPTNEAIPYVMFQMGMCYYQQIDTIDRDSGNAVNAINAFSRLLRAFPDTPYTDEAKFRIRAARNFLAHHEYYVAIFYVRQQAYDEALTRLEFLLQQYPESVVAPKAQILLDKLKNGKPPRRTLFGWLPRPAIDWEDIPPEK
jgi:outer membrane protein assembly factor BamD